MKLPRLGQPSKPPFVFHPAGICFSLFLLTGCHRNFFAAKGYAATEGPAFGHWSSTPEGCTRDPQDALPDSETRTVASFLWENPADHNIMLRDHRMAHTPDAPESLTLQRADAGGYNVRIKTVQTGGWLITPQDCTTLSIETEEQTPGFPGGRPSLGGAVNLECQVKDSRVQAHFTFDRCDY